jgi:hypothetical protein
MFSNAFLIFFTLELRFYSKQKNVLITSFTPEFMFCFKKKMFLSPTHSCLFSIHRMIVPSLQFLAAEITSQLYKQNGNIFQVIPQPCISLSKKSVLFFKQPKVHSDTHVHWKVQCLHQIVTSLMMNLKFVLHFLQATWISIL